MKVLFCEREPEFLYVRYWMAQVGAYLKGTKPLRDCQRR